MATTHTTHTTRTIHTRQCSICGRTGRISVPADAADALERGTPVQDALPGTPRDLREQVISGIHPHCWTDLFGPTH